MHLKFQTYWLAIFIIDICTCQTNITNTTSSRREIFERQAIDAYQNACYGLQELSNWMSVVFKMKSLWTTSAINDRQETSGRSLDTDKRQIPPLPERPKTSGSDCSLRNAKVTFQTYLHLQRQLLQLKTIMGRNIVKSSSIKLNDANVSLRERAKVLDTFNETLNDIFHKLRQSTQRLVTSDTSGDQIARTMENDLMPGNIFTAREMNNIDDYQKRSAGFFQVLGKAIDGIVSSTLSSRKKHSVNSKEHTENIGKNDSPHEHLEIDKEIIYEEVNDFGDKDMETDADEVKDENIEKEEEPKID